MSFTARKTAAIVNPKSADGRTGRVWPEIERRLTQRLGHVTVRFTERAGHGIELTRELLAQGFGLIIGAGGDGTFNEIANGFIARDELVRPGACMGILPAGTGGDFRRMFGFASPRGIDLALETLATGRPEMIDVGKVRYLSHTGQPSERYFVNLVSFGMGGAVAAGARNFLTPLGGQFAFFWSTFCVLLGYRGKRVQLSVDGGEPAIYRVTNVAVGNGQFHGGGMRPCPAAAMNDGILEVTVIEYMNMLQLLRDIRVLYSGEIYRHPKVRSLRGTRIDAKGQGAVLIEVDGEPLGRLPVDISVLPARMPVMCSSRNE
ncbi:MAG: diacylglycerol/lipid kinase family protein [Terriglobia bacterium]